MIETPASVRVQLSPEARSELIQLQIRNWLAFIGIMLFLAAVTGMIFGFILMHEMSILTNPAPAPSPTGFCVTGVC